MPWKVPPKSTGSMPGMITYGRETSGSAPKMTTEKTKRMHNTSAASKHKPPENWALPWCNAMAWLSEHNFEVVHANALAQHDPTVSGS